MTHKGQRGGFPPWETLGLSNLFLQNDDIAAVRDRKTLPAGYALRTTNFNAQDVRDLAVTLDMAFGIQHGEWNEARVLSAHVEDTTVKKTFVITHSDDEGRETVIACGSARLEPKFPGKGYMHWVAVHPDHQGHGLASIISVAVIREFVDTHHLTGAVLETQDTSLPAISTYLKAGYRPVAVDESHPARWRLILPQLGLSADDFLQG